MVQLQDFSSLRSPQAEDVIIPLNGETYRAVPEPAADTLLDSVGQVADAQGLAQALEGVDVTDEKSLREAVATNPMLAVRLGVGGLSQTEKAIRFLQQVLYPEDAVRFAENMKPAPASWPKAKRTAHEKRKITLPQALAVYRSLQEHYSGHPTEASPSSQGGAADTGATSTDGAGAEE